MKKQYLLLLLALILIVPGVLAEDFITAQLQPFNLIAGCDAYGIVCRPDNVQCNISLRNLDNTYIIRSGNMTISENGDLNFTFNSTAMRYIGTLNGWISCSDGVSNKTVPFSLLVTPGNFDKGNLNYLILFLGIGSFVLLAFSIKEENPIMGFITGVLFLLTSILLFSQGLFGFQNVYSQGVASVYMVMFAWCGLSSGYSWIEEMKVRFS